MRISQCQLIPSKFSSGVNENTLFGHREPLQIQYLRDSIREAIIVSIDGEEVLSTKNWGPQSTLLLEYSAAQLRDRIHGAPSCKKIPVELAAKRKLKRFAQSLAQTPSTIGCN